MKHSNYILLGIGISYLVLAIIQWRMSGLLPMSVYFAIAFVSMNLTLFETIMNLVELAVTSQSRALNTISEGIALCEREIEVFSKYHELDSLIDERKEIKRKLFESKDKVKSDIIIKRMVTARNIVSILEIVLICIALIVFPLKNIPNDLSSNKMLNLMSLQSFSFLFFSFFIKNECMSDKSSEKNLQVSNTVSNYYLDIIDKVAPREDEK